MDIAKALTFIMEDEEYIRKLGVGIGVVIGTMLLSPLLIGLLGIPILYGYCIRLMQNVRDNRSRPLPEWDDWGGDLGRGFKYLVVTLVWALPALLLSIPIVIGSLMADSGGAGEFFGVVLLLGTSCLMVLYAIFVSLAQPGFTLAFAKDESISSGLQMSTVWQWTMQNLGQVVIVALVIIGVSFIITALAGIVGTLLCVVGLIVTIPLGSLVTMLFQHHLYGQLAVQSPMYPSSTSSLSDLAIVNEDPGLGAGDDFDNAFTGESGFEAKDVSSDFDSGPELDSDSDRGSGPDNDPNPGTPGN